MIRCIYTHVNISTVNKRGNGSGGWPDYLYLYLLVYIYSSFYFLVYTYITHTGYHRWSDHLRGDTLHYGAWYGPH